ncbi:MAG: sensor histidine kinase N-terminal domain-containing protein [Candidatus Competibacteraceae bacterium]|nr:sensor histidine kinase N-terminal domain-containing protein [Candidatus Competibacteraceae bacterium]MBK8895781.1 sensor histidine kinase N-terminal domain-containing protein [Candidatus Competibacteraceae bacterium]MBK9953193.1 sensor histidine kinase N-terminal domain-containing protein [Candidatus Competibacteraceae bacterium]
MNSIRQRLLWWLLAGLSAVLAASGYAAYRQARTETNALFDYQLQQTALALRNQNLLALAIGGDNEVTGDLSVQIWDRSRGLLYVSQRQRELPFATQPGFADLAWQNESWRLFALHAGERIVQVAQPSGVRLRMSADIALRNLAPFLLLLPGMGLVVWFGVGASLQPLYRIASEIQRRRPGALEPVAADRLPTEITPLIRALDELLARLAQTLDNQRQFIADAAHELRTPLTAVRLQAALARHASTAEERAGAIQDLEAGLGRATHLIEQLLVMARLDAEPTGRLEPMDLLELAKTVVVEQSPIADSKALDLGLLSGEPATMTGDPAELRALLDNLVGNALRYTPAGGRVDIEVRQTETEVVLAVSDTGPGIPPAEQTRVFDRFYRGADAAAPGSGLGLAIVRRVADRHHARIDLDSSQNGSGLRVTVRFPQARVMA